MAALVQASRELLDSASRYDPFAIDRNTATRMTRNIIDYEQRKGEVTKTFSRLIRKELRKAQ